MDYNTEISKKYSTEASIGLLLLRLIPFSMLFVFHGWGKLMGAYGYLFQREDWLFIGAIEKLGFPYPEYFALGSALAESLVCVFLIFGLLTRFWAAVVMFNFMVAVYQQLITDMKFELAALYLVPAAALLFLGGGDISLGAMTERRYREEPEREYSDKVKTYDRDIGERSPMIEASERTEEHPQKTESRS